MSDREFTKAEQVTPERVRDLLGLYEKAWAARTTPDHGIAILANYGEIALSMLPELLEANNREVERRREAEALALKYQATAAEQGSRIFRMRLALQMARAWVMGDSYSGAAQVLLKDWIDKGDWGPLPWPDDVSTRRWLIQNGYDRMRDGHIGMISTAEIANA